MGLLRFLGIEKYLKKVKTYVDEKVEEISNKEDNVKAPTPDWDATETQEGYIKNKPFELMPWRSDWVNSDATIYMHFEKSYDKVIIYNVNTEDYYTLYKGGSTHILINSDPALVEFQGDKIIVDLDGVEWETAYSYFSGCNVRTINCISDDVIPETIARRSDVHSTDETLIKYLVNPYVITTGEQIPEDLHNLIFEEGVGLKPVIMSVCVVSDNGDNMKYAIMAHNMWNIYPADGQEKTYNNTDRAFE